MNTAFNGRWAPTTEDLHVLRYQVYNHFKCVLDKTRLYANEGVAYVKKSITEYFRLGVPYPRFPPKCTLTDKKWNTY